ncbi:hypothetical protein Dgeo_3072 (plasmid) [Deinococcus geothermalis DSM 11300]|uniref:Uncharacterized protein n=1 Tax=Deinococcus geothermalis (strain DSM 11300 / CIP 105573 / AG-3a) TaxID=319795 RepID=A8ZRK4_DEIGD|nr:hypothetical protein [Deinococcus geothermalis]ABW35113.1 hypothetical protein Dgeo_3072 [Deinococcus geothermalis DSM 11300]
MNSPNTPDVTMDGLPFGTALDEAMDRLPRPEALRLEATVMDAVVAAQARCASSGTWQAVVDACQGFPALLEAIRAWWSSLLLLPVAL